MSMTAGSATVTFSGATLSASGSGMALTLANAIISALDSNRPLGLYEVGDTTQDILARLIQQLSNGLAAGVVSYIQANAAAVISTSLGGLQTSAASGSPTTAPSTQHTIPIQ
jgi:hypothetical protein